MLLLAIAAAPAAAGDFRGGDSVNVAAGETIDDDMYVGAGTVTIDGTVDGDLTVGGGTVTVGGEVTGSLNVGGGTVDVTGTIGGAVLVAGGTVRIAADVGRDVVVAGGTVTIDPGAMVGGDVAGGAGTLTISGEVGGDVLGGAGTLDIGGTVHGSLDVTSDSLRILPTAVVGGDVEYTSAQEAAIAPEAQIGGEVRRHDPPPGPAATGMGDNPILAFLGLLLGMLVFGYALLLVRPRLLYGSSAELRTRPWVSLGIGLGAWIGQVLLVLALFILAGVVGIVSGALSGAFAVPAVVVILLIVIGAIVSAVPVAMTIGTLVLRGGVSPYLVFAGGAAIWAAVLTVAGLIDGGLGFLCYLVAWILGLGAFTLYAWRTRTQPYQLATEAVPAARPPDPPWTAPPPAPPSSTDPSGP
jgi:cytoskeletal protein CcmA (bactofilin family)